jgi:membrane-bound ClpP family serine protease
MLGVAQIYIPIFAYFLTTGLILYVVDIKKPKWTIAIIGIYSLILGFILTDIQRTLNISDQIYHANQAEIELKNQKIGDLEQQIKILQEKK